MGILNRPRDSPRQFLLYLDNFIDSIECVNVFVHRMANLAVLRTPPSYICCRTDKLAHWWATSNYSVEIVPAVSEMIMYNSLLHTVKINRGTFCSWFKKIYCGSCRTATQLDCRNWSGWWFRKCHLIQQKPLLQGPSQQPSFAMWTVSQTSHPRDVISHASITLSQDPNKLGIFLRKQTLSMRQQMFHICCADVKGLKP